MARWPSRVTVVGVATDDPTQTVHHASVRLWKYPHRREDELLVPRFAAAHGLPVFTGRVKTPEFFEMFLDEWRPALCLMATFGQKIPTALINYPSLGFYNFHHSGETWPSYPGPDPIAAMVRDGRKHLVLTIHKVTDVIDGGEFVARSHRVAIPDGINADRDAPDHLAADGTVHPSRGGGDAGSRRGDAGGCTARAAGRGRAVPRGRPQRMPSTVGRLIRGMPVASDDEVVPSACPATGSQAHAPGRDRRALRFGPPRRYPSSRSTPHRCDLG